MPNKLLIWIREHKLATVLILLVVFLLVKDSALMPFSYRTSNFGGEMMMQRGAVGVAPAAQFGKSMDVYESAPPATGGGGGAVVPAPERMVSRNVQLSMVVKDVAQTVQTLIDTAEGAGGYMVSSTLTNPTQSGTATVAVRVPSKSLRDVTEAFKKLGVKVVSERVSGQDITDQYQDIKERLRLLEETKVKFENILKTSTDVQDTLSVLREIQQLQYQIDSLVGQEKYLASAAQYSLVTVTMSQDEYELPFAPDEPWSASNVFKQAVRELIRTLRMFAEQLIWFGVFAVIWLPVVLVGFFIYRRFLRKPV